MRVKCPQLTKVNSWVYTYGSPHLVFVPYTCSEILIEKHWRGVARRDVAERFWATVCKHRSKRVRKASEGAVEVLHPKAQRVT